MASKAEDKAKIQAIVDERVRASRLRDASAAAKYFAPDVLLFDVVNPLRHTGKDSAAGRAEQWFSSFDGPIEFDVANLQIAVGDDTAFSHALSHVHGKVRTGADLDMWWRVTTCYRKINGVWTVVHEHNSVPFDPATGQASLGLQP